MTERNNVLEIGVGANDFVPMPTILVGVDRVIPSRIQDNPFYVGIDAPLATNRYYRDMHRWFVGSEVVDEDCRQTVDEIALAFQSVKKQVGDFRKADKFHFMVTDGLFLPFRNAAFDEVYMSNVLGSQMHDSAVEKLIEESRRVLGPMGRLVARENVTPQWVSEDIDEIVQTAGFDRPEIHKFGTAEYDGMVKHYGASWQDIEPVDEFMIDDFFFMTAKANTGE